MTIIQLKKITKINQIMFWACLFISILVLYFNLYTFVPTESTMIGAYIISGVYILNMAVVSTLLWRYKIYPPEYEEKLTIKDIFIHFDNDLGLTLVFTFIAGLFLATTLIFAVSGLYTSTFGTETETTEVVLYKIAHTQNRGFRGATGKSGIYSAKLTNINKSINISVSDYYFLKKGSKVKIIGKKSFFGLLINKFTRA